MSSRVPLPTLVPPILPAPIEYWPLNVTIPMTETVAAALRREDSFDSRMSVPSPQLPFLGPQVGFSPPNGIGRVPAAEFIPKLTRPVSSVVDKEHAPSAVVVRKLPSVAFPSSPVRNSPRDLWLPPEEEDSPSDESDWGIDVVVPGEEDDDEATTDLVPKVSMPGFQRLANKFDRILSARIKRKIEKRKEEVPVPAAAQKEEILSEVSLPKRRSYAEVSVAASTTTTTTRTTPITTPITTTRTSTTRSDSTRSSSSSRHGTERSIAADPDAEIPVVSASSTSSASSHPPRLRIHKKKKKKNQPQQQPPQQQRERDRRRRGGGGNGGTGGTDRTGAKQHHQSQTRRQGDRGNQRQKGSQHGRVVLKVQKLKSANKKHHRQEQHQQQRQRKHRNHVDAWGKQHYRRRPVPAVASSQQKKQTAAASAAVVSAQALTRSTHHQHKGVGSRSAKFRQYQNQHKQHQHRRDTRHEQRRRTSRGVSNANAAWGGGRRNSRKKGGGGGGGGGRRSRRIDLSRRHFPGLPSPKKSE